MSDSLSHPEPLGLDDFLSSGLSVVRVSDLVNFRYASGLYNVLGECQNVLYASVQESRSFEVRHLRDAPKDSHVEVFLHEGKFRRPILNAARRVAESIPGLVVPDWRYDDTSAFWSIALGGTQPRREASWTSRYSWEQS